jgi:hypothetical protein
MEFFDLVSIVEKAFKNVKAYVLIRQITVRRINLCLHWQRRTSKRRKSTKIKLGNNGF